MIQIRELHIMDADTLSQCMNNVKIWNNLRDFIPYPYARKDAIDFIHLSQKEAALFNFAITYNDNFCGVIGLTRQTDVHRQSMELGYWICEAYWNKGIATRAIKLATEWAFSNLDINRIFANVFQHNEASKKALLKNGFLLEGTLKKAVLKNEILLDEYIFAKLRS